jgi:hypothetical protein
MFVFMPDFIECVVIVFFVSDPLQVATAVIRFDVVYVVDYFQLFGVWKEGEGDETIDPKCFVRTIFI